MKDIILKTMLEFIGKNYGSQEMEDPCYNMEEMASVVAKKIEEISIEDKIGDAYEL